MVDGQMEPIFVLSSTQCFRMAENKHLKHCQFDKFEPLHIETMKDILYQPPAVVQAPAGLGNASTRTHKQAQLALEDATEYLKLTRNDTVSFTDGSALGNPGPCGGSAIIYWQGISSNPTEHRVPVSRLSNSVHGELAGMELNLDLLANCSPARPLKIHLLVDCQAAIDIATSPRITDTYTTLQTQIRQSYTKLLSNSSTVTIKKIGGHIDLPGNERADFQAKEAAKDALLKPSDVYISDLPSLRSSLKSSILKHWQTQWDRSNSGSWPHNLMPKVAQKAPDVKSNRRAEVKLSRLIIGNNKLKDRLHRIYPEFHPDSTCTCGEGPETATHVLLHCQRFSAEREILLEEVERALSELPNRRTSLGINTLLAPKELPEKTSCRILQATLHFISSVDLDC